PPPAQDHPGGLELHHPLRPAPLPPPHAHGPAGSQGGPAGVSVITQTYIQHNFSRLLRRSRFFYNNSFTDFLIIFSNLRKCRKGLEYQAFPAFCISEDTPHIMAFRSLTWR